MKNPYKVKKILVLKRKKKKKRKDPLWLSYDNQEAFDLVVGDFVSDHVCRKYNRNDGIHIYFDV